MNRNMHCRILIAKKCKKVKCPLILDLVVVHSDLVILWGQNKVN